MREVKDMMDALRDQGLMGTDLGQGEGIKPDLGLGGGSGMTGADGRPMDMSKLPGGDAGGGFEDPTGRLPDMSSNRGGNPLRPSTNPADWMSGAAGQDSGGDSVWYVDRTFGGGDDGRGYGRDRSGNLHLRRDSDGATRILTPNAQGGNDIVESSPTRNGGTHVYRNTHHANGDRVVSDEYYDSRGNLVHSQKTVNGEPVPDRPQTGIDKTQDPDSEGNNAVADWLIKRGMLDVRPDYSGKPRDKVVNPGPEGAMSDPKAPRLQIPEDQLVINPNPDAASGPGRTPDEGALEREMEERRCMTRDCDDRRGER
jgi:hypothetical protein